MTEVQDIFNKYGEDFLKNHKLSYEQSKAFTAILNCRTAALGGHADICENCGSTRISYNSCRNRHCPKCQTLAKERWIEGQKANLLNVGYFHVVFTIPGELNTLIYQNQTVCYNILFRAVSETLQELCADKKYLGAKIGFTSVLHTWGQNLYFHPHIHCIVAGGGLNALGKWVHSHKKFFLPVKVISRKFRGKFLALLKSANLEFFGSSSPYSFPGLIDACYKKEWVVYCKPPFKTAACVVEYLGRYTHRVAISNNRILSVKNGFVSFKWRDYKDNSKWKVMTVSADEFIRRFLLHILPHGFMKIRHYGLLGNRNKLSKLRLCKFLTRTPLSVKPVMSAIALAEKLIGRSFRKCPDCGCEAVVRHGLSPPNTSN